MPLTRRTRRFAELAGLVDEYCDAMGVDIPAPVVDQLLNDRIASAAENAEVSERTALGHLRDSAAAAVARSLVQASARMSGAPGRRGHLRAVPRID